jgi:hypothetical protein
MLDMLIVDPERTRDLRPQALDACGRLRVLPAAFWAGTTVPERALFGHRTGIYSLPTLELADRLATLIDGRAAIEIGAGNGALAGHLGIEATDSYQQRDPKYRRGYEAAGLAIVPYDVHVTRLDAAAAVRSRRPQVVLACWVTHRYDPARHHAAGNEVGVDFADVLDHCAELILIGNEHTHRHNPLWGRPHRIEYPPYVFSRAHTGRREFVARWAGSRS